MKNSLGITWNLEKRNVNDLIPFSDNPRKMEKHEAAKLAELIDDFGLIDKPVITRDNIIIGGHQRIAILKKKRVKEIDVYVPDRDLEDKDIRRLCLGLNRAIGEFDWDILSDRWETDDMIAGGMTPEDLFGKIQEEPPKEDKKKKLKQCPNCGHEF